MFDPYHKWLGIPPGKRPPTPYQLLAISETERDRDVIEAATVRQSAYVRNFQNGPNGEQAARILSEISTARDVLIDPVRRRAMDDSLAAEKPKPKATAAKPVATSVAQAVVVRASPVVKTPVASSREVSSSRSSRRRSTSGVPLVTIVGILGVVAVASGVGVYLATRNSGNQQNASADSPVAKPDGLTQTSSPPTVRSNEAGKHPVPENQSNPERPQPPTMTIPGPPPGFGQPPPGFGQPPPGFGQPPAGFGQPPMGFGRPPNTGQPKSFTPPPGLFKGSGSSGDGKGDTPASGSANEKQGAKPNPKKRDETKKPKTLEAPSDDLDEQLMKLKDGDVFERDAAAKKLAALKVVDDRKSDVATALNNLIAGEKNPPESVYDAVAIWADDDTVKIIADKLSARPWVDRNAIRAAGKMKNPKLALPLCILLENFFNWEDATRALQQMGPAAEDRVRALLNHRDPKMRVQVCIILSTIGTQKSLPALRKASGDKATSVAAKAAIQEINERIKSSESEESKDASSSEK